MTLWRLEWLRLVRTRRWLVLVGVFLFFGLTGPLSVKYQDAIVRRLGGGVQVHLPPPSVPQALAAYTKNVAQIGVIVLVAVAAAALAVDGRPEAAAFFRTRVRRASSLLMPRFGMSAAAGGAAFLVGALGAWYETVVLIAAPSPLRLVGGILLTCLYLAFAVAVTGLAAGLVRSSGGAVGVTLAVLLAIPILGLFHPLGPWLPSRLLGAVEGLAAGDDAGTYLRPAVVAAAAMPLSLWGATRLLARREL